MSGVYGVTGTIGRSSGLIGFNQEFLLTHHDAYSLAPLADYRTDVGAVAAHNGTLWALGAGEKLGRLLKLDPNDVRTVLTEIDLFGIGDLLPATTSTTRQSIYANASGVFIASTGFLPLWVELTQSNASTVSTRQLTANSSYPLVSQGVDLRVRCSRNNWTAPSYLVRQFSSTTFGYVVSVVDQKIKFSVQLTNQTTSNFSISIAPSSLGCVDNITVFKWLRFTYLPIPSNPNQWRLAIWDSNDDGATWTQRVSGIHTTGGPLPTSTNAFLIGGSTVTNQGWLGKVSNLTVRNENDVVIADLALGNVPSSTATLWNGSPPNFRWIRSSSATGSATVVGTFDTLQRRNLTTGALSWIRTELAPSDLTNIRRLVVDNQHVYVLSAQPVGTSTSIPTTANVIHKLDGATGESLDQVVAEREFQGLAALNGHVYTAEYGGSSVGSLGLRKIDPSDMSYAASYLDEPRYDVSSDGEYIYASGPSDFAFELDTYVHDPDNLAQLARDRIGGGGTVENKFIDLGSKTGFLFTNPGRFDPTVSLFSWDTAHLFDTNLPTSTSTLGYLPLISDSIGPPPNVTSQNDAPNRRWVDLAVVDTDVQSRRGVYVTTVSNGAFCLRTYDSDTLAGQGQTLADARAVHVIGEDVRFITRPPRSRSDTSVKGLLDPNNIARDNVQAYSVSGINPPVFRHFTLGGDTGHMFVEKSISGGTISFPSSGGPANRLTADEPHSLPTGTPSSSGLSARFAIVLKKSDWNHSRRGWLVNSSTFSCWVESGRIYAEVASGGQTDVVSVAWSDLATPSQLADLGISVFPTRVDGVQRLRATFINTISSVEPTVTLLFNTLFRLDDVASGPVHVGEALDAEMFSFSYSGTGTEQVAVDVDSFAHVDIPNILTNVPREGGAPLQLWTLGANLRIGPVRHRFSYQSTTTDIAASLGPLAERHNASGVVRICDDGEHAYLLSTGPEILNGILKIALTPRAVVGQIALPENPIDMALLRNSLYVIYADGTLLRVDAGNLSTVSTHSVPNARRIDSDSNYIYVTRTGSGFAQVRKYDDTVTLVETAELGPFLGDYIQAVEVGDLIYTVGYDFTDGDPEMRLRRMSSTPLNGSPITITEPLVVPTSLGTMFIAPPVVTTAGWSLGFLR